MAYNTRSGGRGYGAASGGNRMVQKGPADHWVHGDWNARCDECYLKQKASQMFLRWDNCRVCFRCIEIRNPQDFVRGVPDNQAPPWTRPTPPPTFASGGTGGDGGGDELIDAQIVGGSLLG
ncbi:MAG: hypothetical protein RLZZ373_2961 [Pseudomonadota bacterium]|jgi:hypothetical protein